MTAIVKLKTKHNVDIDIELLDNEFISDFVDQMKIMNETFHLISYPMHYDPKPRQWNQTHVNLMQQQIIDSIVSLNSAGFNFPVMIQDINFDSSNTENNWPLLNRLHRCFTTSHQSCHLACLDPDVQFDVSIKHWEFNTSHTFTLAHKDYESFRVLVHNINTAVHQLELYMASSRKILVPQNSEHRVFFDGGNPRDPKDPTTHQYPAYFCEIKSEHFKYFDDKSDCDVWLPLQIQGKHYWDAFYNFDDPTHFDITTDLLYSGSFQIETRSTARNPILLDWLRTYGINPGPDHCGMPIGRVVQGKHIVDQLQYGDIESLIILEQ